MPYLEESDEIMEDCEPEVSVIDVYDIASEIGKEFEKIIDVYGTDAVTSLMPKVIGALEKLEGLATRNERENSLIQELRSRIAHLESDKVVKAQDRHRFEKELEQIEEHWREESQDLVSMVSRLQDENRKLNSMLAEKRAEKSPDPGAILSPEVDMALLQRLRILADHQREQLRQRDKELQTKQTEVESLSAQVEQFNVLTRELRRKQRMSQTQVHALLDERADFLAQLHDQQREVQVLKQRLGLAEKENEDLSTNVLSPPDLRNKVIYDLDDPNRPRFTTQELKDILHERNELKGKLSDLEEELEMYRPRTTVPNSPQEEEAVVEGPLPQEPDDAPWKKSNSGIRKFFRRLFSEGVGGSGASTVLPFVGSSSSNYTSGAKPILSSSLSKIGLSGHLSSAASSDTTV